MGYIITKQHQICHSFFTMIRYRNIFLACICVLSLVSTSAYAQTADETSETSKHANVAVFPHHTFSLDAGYGWLETKIIVEGYHQAGETISTKHAGGFDYRLAYDYTFRSGFGVGLSYSEWQSYLAHDELSMHLHYVGPYAQARCRLLSRLYGMARLGVGYGWLSTDFNANKSAFAIESGLGVEYRLTRHFGISANLNTNIIFAKSEGNAPENEDNKIARNAIMAGARIYF